MIVFELKMANAPKNADGTTKRYIKMFPNKNVSDDRIGEYKFEWPNGKSVTIEVTKITTKEANALKSINNGFCGHDWMVNSIIEKGKIEAPCK